MLFHQPRPHYDHFFFHFPQFCKPSDNDGTVQEQGGLDSTCMAGYCRRLVLPPRRFNPCEDAVLPPHELNRWEDHRHVLPLHILKHEEDVWPTTTWTQSLGGPFAEYKGCLVSDPFFTTFAGGMSVIRVKEIHPCKCCQTYLVPILLHDHCFVDKIENEIFAKGTWSKAYTLHELCKTILSLACAPPPQRHATHSFLFSPKCWL